MNSWLLAILGVYFYYYLRLLFFVGIHVRGRRKACRNSSLVISVVFELWDAILIGGGRGGGGVVRREVDCYRKRM